MSFLAPALLHTFWELPFFEQVWDRGGERWGSEMCSIVFLVNFTLFYRVAWKTMHG